MHQTEIELTRRRDRGTGKRRSLADRIVSGSAMFVALSSLAIALYEVRMMREHDRISVWPYVSVYHSDGMGTVPLPGARVSLLEIGPGPAAIAFHRAAQSGMRVRTCYCSLYEQCWLLDDAKPEPQRVGRCEEPATPFVQ